jgi:hypothetical protein
MHREGEAMDFAVGRLVEGGDFRGMARVLMHCGETSYSFHRATSGGADGGNDVKDFHDGQA